MKTEQEIREEIKKTTESYQHVLDAYPATIDINAPRALMQQTATSVLDTLYKTIGETRPKYNCDDWTKTNH